VYGVRPESSPLAEEVMREVGVDISEDEPKEIKELFQEYFTFVITLSDDATERSPVWPFTRNLFHWSLADPAATEGSPEQRREAFRRFGMRLRITCGTRDDCGSASANALNFALH